MSLKNFEDYGKLYSKDPKTFEKRIAFACHENYGLDIFELIKTPFDFKGTNESPIIRWGDFSFESNDINENSLFHYNANPLPKYKDILKKMGEADFLPKSTKDRRLVKKLKFPITASSDNSKEEFKTYGKFKKSEKNFDSFDEKITPLTRFDIIAYKKKPIHVQERINKIGFDVDLRGFKYLDEANSILKNIYEKNPADFYHVEVLESNGKLFLNDITQTFPLTPSQGVRMYETAYSQFYESELPAWFKKKELFEKIVLPYYKKRYYDSLLIKPKHSIDFKKYGDS